MNKLKKNPTLNGMYKFLPEVTYSVTQEKELKMDLIVPWNADQDFEEKTPLPCIVFVQGSAWTTPDRCFELPQLCQIARTGYVIATCDHRSSMEGAKAMSYLYDIKCAIRYLRANAELYNLDPSRIAIWGTSSGGNTAMLVGVTGDSPEYRTDEYGDYSDSVNAVVSCFGPADVNMTFHAAPENQAQMDEFLVRTLGEDRSSWSRDFYRMSPSLQITGQKTYPPFLLLHGSGDPVVPFAETEQMYANLLEAGVKAEAWEIEGAEHEGDFWSNEVLDVITEFLSRTV